MIVKGKIINIEDFNFSLQDELKKRSNGLVLRDSHIEILKRYGINYEEYTTLSSLIFAIEEILETEESEDLESVSYELSEINYYNYINK